MAPPNDWEITKLLRYIAGLLIILLGLIMVESQGLDVPILRQITGFIFLTFVPGILVLRILRVHNLGMVKTMCYSVGLSIAFIMFTGAIINTLFPHVGISGPISLWPVAGTLISLTIVMSVLAYVLDNSFYPKPTRPTENNGYLFPSSLFMILIVIMATLGALVYSSYENNSISLTVLVAIAIVPVLVVLRKFIPESMYPWALLCIAIALLFQQTLSSPYLSGWDIHKEEYFRYLVMENAHWDSTLAEPYNGMLSVSMIGPIYALILDISTAWVAKVVHPLIFAIAPVILFEVYRPQVGTLRAFLGVFIFLSMFQFVFGMPSLPRQQVAELFIALALLVAIDGNLRQSSKSFLEIIFLLGLVVSHYGTAYIIMAFLAVGFLMIVFIEKIVSPHASKWDISTIRHLYPFGNLANKHSDGSKGMFRGSLILVTLVFGISWSMYIASSTIFVNYVGVWENTAEGISEIFSTTSREARVGESLGMGFFSVPMLGQIFRILQYLVQIFLVIGFVQVFLNPRGFRFTKEYWALSIPGMLLLVACIILPYFSGHLNVPRIFHLMLILLSPFVVIGSEVVYRSVLRLFTFGKTHMTLWESGVKPRLPYQENQSGLLEHTRNYGIVFIFLVLPYFFFCTGFVFEISNQKHTTENIPWTVGLSSHKWDAFCYNNQEYAAAKWVTKQIEASPERNKSVLADDYGELLFNETIEPNVRAIKHNRMWTPEWEYIYLRTWNLENGMLWLQEKGFANQTPGGHLFIDHLEYLKVAIDKRGQVYENMGARVSI